MHVVYAVADEGFAVPKPRELILVALRFFASVFGPFDVRSLTQNAGFDERADVHADAVVEVGVPADGLFGQRFPADENVVGRLAGEDQFQFVLQRLSGGESQIGSGLAGLGLSGLGVDPIFQVGVGQVLQRLVVELVVVDQTREAIFASVPNLPNERPVAPA